MIEIFKTSENFPLVLYLNSSAFVRNETIQRAVKTFDYCHEKTVAMHLNKRLLVEFCAKCVRFVLHTRTDENLYFNTNTDQFAFGMNLWNLRFC